MNAIAEATREMPVYRSHKKVWALQIKSIEDLGTDTTTDENPVVRIHFVEPGYAPVKMNLRSKPTPEVGGYYIVYKDGYCSFSPAGAFESGYTRLLNSLVVPDGMDFPAALVELKQGKMVRRAGWNGKGMFLFLVPGSTFTVNRAPLLGIYAEGTVVKYHSHIDIKSVDGSVAPWVASQTDLLANDWELAV